MLCCTQRPNKPVRPQRLLVGEAGGTNNSRKPGVAGGWGRALGGGGGPLAAGFLMDKAHRTDWLSFSSGKGHPGLCPAGRGHPCNTYQASSVPSPHPPLPRDFIFTLVESKKTKVELQRMEIY